MSDEEIDRSDIPELDESFFERETVLFPPPKRQLTIRLDEDILEWLKGQGRGYQTLVSLLFLSQSPAFVLPAACHEGHCGGLDEETHDGADFESAVPS